MPVDKKDYVGRRDLLWAALVIVCLAAGVLSIFINVIIPIAVIFVLVNLVIVFRYPFYGLLLYLMVFLLRPAELYPILANFRIELLLGAAVLLSIIVRQKLLTGKLTLPMDRVTLSLLAFGVVILLSMFTSYEKTETVNQFITFLKILVFYYLIVTLITDKRKFIAFTTTFVLLIGYIGLDSMSSYLMGKFIHAMSVDRLYGTTSAGGDPNTLATTLVTTMPLIVASAYNFRNYFLKIALVALLLCLGWLVVITASRGGLLALLSVIVMAIVISKHKTSAFVGLILLMFVGWQLMPDQYRARYGQLTEISGNVNQVSSGRWEIWKAGLHMMAARPLLGVGAGAFVHAYGSGDFGSPDRMAPHNVYIQVITTTGLLGAAVWITFLVTFIQTLRRVSRRAPLRYDLRWMLPYKSAFVVTLGALFVSGTFGHTLYRYTWYMIAALAVALFQILQSAEAEPDDETSEPAHLAQHLHTEKT